MSDQYDHLLAGLSDEDEEATEEAQEPQRATRSARKGKGGGKAQQVASKAAEEPTSRQRGKRNDPDYTQVNAFVRKDLKPSLFFYLKSEGRTLTDLLEEAVEAYVEEQGGVLKGPKD